MAAQQEITDKTNSLNSLQSQFDTLQNEYTDAVTIGEQLQQQLEQRQQELLDAQTNLTNAQADLNTAQSDIESLESLVQQAESNLAITQGEP